MYYNSPAVLEMLMRDRVADRLHEADQRRLADSIAPVRAERRPRHPAHLAASVARYVTSLF